MQQKQHNHWSLVNTITPLLCQVLWVQKSAILM